MKCLLLLQWLFVIQIVQSCPERWALKKVDVWTHPKIDGRGEHKQSVSVYDLDTHEMIEVIKANVSVLCDGMIKNFPRLKYFTLIDANISKIQPGAFQNLPSLTHLSLAVNHLTSIERYQFGSLTKLRILYLSKNQIENVEGDAFFDLSYLRKIYLDRNKIHEIDAEWFSSNTGISVIDLSFNSISKLQKGAFTLPKNSMVEIRLQNNEIEEIEASAVTTNAGDEEIPYLTLLLNYNNLTGIPVDVVKKMDAFNSKLHFDYNGITCFAPETLRILKEVSLELHADNNPLTCDCLEAATNFVKDNDVRATFYYSSTECQLPGLKPDSFKNAYFTN